ncbi:hypothetical protein SDRG_16021 [Saprolegnia diclina VS20]|uniref:Uncharacterized protein n=1 Tax=Saprolegnia diclina (strain VS20) TaxID=1156394 RepID=T0PYI4_SAPDV|nr:hypothetical protein SDRG_16021 [Saprolegnia diclina VS20]EQC26130.1 hypothetical protein SDRG_16021 [Saprolegnia diclina VS20]|eukprot:XP_008620432.1 hypothetical protein SDRG_16021 [Saprolegnia diclina VS20]
MQAAAAGRSRSTGSRLTVANARLIWSTTTSADTCAAPSSRFLMTALSLSSSTADEASSGVLKAALEARHVHKQEHLRSLPEEAEARGPLFPTNGRQEAHAYWTEHATTLSRPGPHRLPPSSDGSHRRHYPTLDDSEEAIESKL